MSDLKDLKEIAKLHLNDLVIDESFTVVRLLDVIDGEDDYYWVMKSPHRGIVHASCVGSFTPLKGKIDPCKYHNLNVYFYMNEPYWKDYDSVRDAIPEEFKMYKRNGDFTDILKESKNG